MRVAKTAQFRGCGKNGKTLGIDIAALELVDNVLFLPCESQTGEICARHVNCWFIFHGLFLVTINSLVYLDWLFVQRGGSKQLVARDVP